MSKDKSDEQEIADWTICVVCIDVLSKKREYKNFFLGFRGSEDEANDMRGGIAGLGFKGESQRYFPDQIESVTLKLSDKTESENTN